MRPAVVPVAPDLSDIGEHLPLLQELAGQCDSVVEFGVRKGISSRALVSSVGRWMISYDLFPREVEDELAEIARRRGVYFKLFVRDSRTARPLKCDMLFIDSEHTYDCLKAELDLHGDYAQRYIALHDTALFGEEGEDGKRPGLRRAVFDWRFGRPAWSILHDLSNCNGLMVLERTRLT